VERKQAETLHCRHIVDLHHLSILLSQNYVLSSRAERYQIENEIYGKEKEKENEKEKRIVDPRGVIREQ
jgi:hypothetical protein